MRLHSVPGSDASGTMWSRTGGLPPDLRVLVNARSSDVRTRIAVRYLQALNERALHKEMSDLLKAPGAFGVLGAVQAVGGAALAAARLEELRKVLEGKGLHPKKARIAWEGRDEDAFVVPGIRPPDLFQIGQRFNQTYVALKSGDGVVSVYAGKGQPKVWVALREDLWKKTGKPLPRGFAQEGPLVFGSSSWDGRSVFDLKKLKSL